MNLDLKKISKAWFDSYFGTVEQKELAAKRLSICETCPSHKVITKKISLATICGECGCPIEKKIFTPTFNDCPLGKWKDVDNEHPIIFKKKVL